MNGLILKVEQTHQLSKQELICLLKADNTAELCAAADKTREKYVGNGVHLRGLIEFSNICKNNCCYCGLRRNNKNLQRYRLSPEEIFETARFGAEKLNLKTIVLQSGEDLFFDKNLMCQIIEKLKTLDIAVTLSVGEKMAEEYQAYKDAGCDRYLIRIETTDKQLYERYDPQMSFEARKQCLKDLKQTGLEVGSGCLVGLPEQKIETYADDILFFKNLDADMVGIGPFIAHPETPLSLSPNGSFELALKVMALTRLLLPDINIPATTAMEVLQQGGQFKALRAGANVLMPNITALKYRTKYNLYPGKSSATCGSENELMQLKEELEHIGRYIAPDKGFRAHS